MPLFQCGKVTEYIYSSTVLMCVHFTGVFPLFATLYFYSTTICRKILLTVLFYSTTFISQLCRLHAASEPE